MPLTNGGEFTVVVESLLINEDGSARLGLRWFNTLSGRVVARRSLILPAGYASPVLDELGNTVITPFPAAWATTLNDNNTETAGRIVTAAGAGALDL